MTREMRRRAVFAGLFVFGALLLGTQPGLAAPAPPTEATAEARPPGPPTGPTDLAPPTGVDPPTTTTTTTATAQPPPPADTTTSTTTKKPVKPPKPVKAAKPAAPPATTTTTPPPTTEPTSIPTPNRIDTGGGSSVPGPPTVLFWVVPGLAVLTLAAGVSGYWLARSEQDRR